ncbi:hypothetical protein [Saccharothrix algeriensis]|uniref:Uncharacterized protein n=1 Tax=Saccharothrix algeriensis TaxID=173560 RepID=A0A8T8HU89_9PSEU|nr:hypothetical protein [Saccharothrix algeriensis]MBM7813463.1 hypothetical protein [Saccharothrix algeriensis]QTR01977.1 hypothetical protein J7S33_22405 [Saccharothrix algeriensis]
MIALITAAVVVALVVYGLERNHRRNRPGVRLAGSHAFEDRDAARVAAELRAAAAHEAPRPRPTAPEPRCAGAVRTRSA